MKATQDQKELAFFIGQLFEYGVCFNYDHSEILSNRKNFIKGCQIFFDNAQDFKNVAFFFRVGAKYLKSNQEEFSKSMVSFHNRQLPDFVHERLKEELAKMNEPTIQIQMNPKQQTKIYLMFNARNGFHKIGRSLNPTIREATLQAEEPEIQMLQFWDGTIKDEAHLHSKYKEFRQRGEWFNLTESHVLEIQEYMNQKQK